MVVVAAPGDDLTTDRAPLDIDALVCDLDGVIYRASQPIAGASEAVARMRSQGIKVIFATNNATHTVEQYRQRLQDLGINTAADDIVTSAVVTVEEIFQRGWAGDTIFLVGGEGIRQRCIETGLELVEGRAGRDAGIVIVSGTPQLTYDHIRDAAFAVRAGARFLATNADPTFPAPDGLWPGAGAIVAAIAVASVGRKPEVMGKPHPPMMEAIGRRLEGRRSVAAIGDQPGTDLAGAAAMGWRTILVLSGVTDAASAHALDPRPDLIVPSIVEATQAVAGPR